MVTVDEAEAAVHQMMLGARGRPVEHEEASGAVDHWYYIYRQAGRAALNEHLSRPFTSLRIVLQSKDCSGEVLSRIGEALDDTGTQWWFLRKADEEGPHLRLRVRRNSATKELLFPRLREALHELYREAMISRWNKAIYEPEIALFGGGEGMAASHAYFCEDSRAIVAMLGCGDRPAESLGPNRHLHPSLSVLVLTSAFQGARLDPFETWDVWRRVLTLRPFPPTAVLDGAVTRTREVLRSAMTDTISGSAFEWYSNQFKDRLGNWRTAARDLGNGLRLLAESGHLERGLREVLSVHVLFHWNRLGFGPGVQSCIAQAAALNSEPG
jgi:thiopeptide-type bacteriocin biosynthesis protein